jgi:flagellar motor switch protein FliG
MMTKIQIEVPDATAQAAQAAGLLTPQAMDRLLSNALRKQQAADYLLAIAGEVAAANIPPMTPEEIQAEVKAARQEKKRRADRH